jgi:hypothetical protein
MMALRKPVPEVTERRVLLRDVLAELAGVDGGRRLDEEAGRVAATLPARMLSTDWAGRPVVNETDAERLLWKLRRDRAEHEAEMSKAIVAAEDEYARRLPPGVVGIEAPGLSWYAPGVVDRTLHGPLTVNEPG